MNTTSTNEALSSACTSALKETHGHLKAILASIGDGVLLEDVEHNLIPLNATANAMLQEMADNFLLGPLRELTAEHADQTVQEESFLRGRGGAGEVETAPWITLERRRFEVGKKVLSVHSAAARADDGTPLGTVIVLRDVTAEVEAEQLKDEFVSHVSHELRTPLTAIKGYSDLLLTDTIGPISDEQSCYLQAIQYHTDILAHMINDLLSYSEMAAWDTLNLQRYPIHLSTIVEDVMEHWSSQLREKKLIIETQIATDLPPVHADTMRLRTVIVNLVRNAWQYTPEGGKVTVRLYARENKVVFEISDTGIGISHEDQEQLFSPFFRVANTVGSRGIGLGLHIAKTIVEQHGGEIHISSEKQAGSTFSVILPAAPTDETPEPSG